MADTESLETLKEMEDIRQNKLWLNYCKKKGYKVVEIPTSKRGVNIFGVLMPLNIFGFKLLKIQRAEMDPNWEALRKIKRENWVISTIIEPQKEVSEEVYKSNGFKLSSQPFLATKTVLIDLRKSENYLWKKLSQNAKRLITKNKNVEAVNLEPEDFFEHWKKNSKVWILSLKELKLLKGELKNKARLLVSTISGELQSGLLLVETKDTANYLYSFTTERGRKSGAHFALVWKAILNAKKRGLKWFDFEGLYDSRWPQKRWLGFSEFKKKFGGRVVTFPGCFQKWF